MEKAKEFATKPETKEKIEQARERLSGRGRDETPEPSGTPGAEPASPGTKPASAASEPTAAPAGGTPPVNEPDAQPAGRQPAQGNPPQAP
jgi:hypothetical protein